MQRIGVFVCWCGSNIAATVDVNAVSEALAREPGVVFSTNYQYMCSESGQNLIKDAIKEHQLTGVVICSCSPRMHEATFRKTVAAAGLNSYMLEIANIREQCSWIHKDKAEATEKAIAKLKPYAVVIATGGVPVRPRSIKGIDLPNVCTAPEIIMGEKKISGKIVAVIGSGMTGLETTEILNESGNHVVVVEMAEEIAPGTWFQLKDDELSRIQKYDTEFMPGKRLMKITEDSVILEDVRTSMLTTVTVDEVVLSLGVRPVNALAKALENQYPYVVTVGDACKSGRIADAVHSAYDAVMRIK